MPLKVLLTLAIAALVLSLVPVAAYASSRTPAEATAHALDELANVCAQRRPECPPTLTPTLTPTPTWTPSRTSTSTPIPPPTATEAPTATPTPESCWLEDQDLGDADNNWIVFDDQGAPVPCPTDIPVEETPIAEPTDTPTSTPTATPRRLPQPMPAAPVSAPAPQVQVVIQTVVVTAVPTETTLPTATATWTSSPTPRATNTATPVPTATPTPTPAVVAIAGAKATSGPVATISHVTVPAPGRWDWLDFFKAAAAVVLVGGLVIWFATRRRVAVWRPRKEATHS